MPTLRRLCYPATRTALPAYRSNRCGASRFPPLGFRADPSGIQAANTTGLARPVETADPSAWPPSPSPGGHTNLRILIDSLTRLQSRYRGAAGKGIVRPEPACGQTLRKSPSGRSPAEAHSWPFSAMPPLEPPSLRPRPRWPAGHSATVPPGTWGTRWEAAWPSAS